MIHSTTRSHFYTELELLLALYTRAKHQHRSQPFLANIRQVIRLATRVHDSLIPGLTDSSRFRRLVTKLQIALTLSTTGCYQVVQLRHFLPLQTALLAIYARLATLAAHLLESAHPLKDPLPVDGVDTTDDAVCISIDVTTLDPVPVRTTGGAAAAPGTAEETEKPSPSENIRQLKAKPKKKRRADAIDELFGSM